MGVLRTQAESSLTGATTAPYQSHVSRARLSFALISTAAHECLPYFCLLHLQHSYNIVKGPLGNSSEFSASETLVTADQSEL